MNHLRYFAFLLLVVSFTSPTALAASAKRILILGDSLTEGYGIPKQKAYPALLEDKLKSNGHKVEVINAGSSGSTSASAVSRLKWHLKVKPDIVVFALGANDGLRGIDAATTEENLNKAIGLAKKNDITVIIAGMKMPVNYGSDYRGKFEQTFERLAKRHKISYIPFLLKDVGGNKDLNLADGIHPNEEGHKKIAETVLPFVKKHL